MSSILLATTNTHLVHTDPYWNNVDLLLDGSSKTQDLSRHGFTLSQSGIDLSTQVTDPYGGSTPSLYFSGTTGDYLRSPASAHHRIGRGDFTIEMWVRITQFRNWLIFFTNRDNMETNTYTWGIQTDADRDLYMWGGGTYFGNKSSALSANTWHYIVGQRNSGLYSLYLDGTRVVTTTAGGARNFTENNYGVGSSSSGSNNEYHIGYIKDLRFTVGVARYSGTAMSVPTRPHPKRGQ